jgi:hypothetical protein
MKRYATLGVIVLIIAVGMRAVAGSGFVSGEGVKGFFIPFVELYLNTFNSPTTAIVLCFAMAVVALLLLFYYASFKIGPVTRRLRHFAASLNSADEQPGSEAVLHLIDGAVEQNRFLARPWELYRATLETAENGRIVAPFSPGRYFDVKALQFSGLRLRMFLGLPNDFVGIGLVFTFLGLVAGLYFASQSMMSADLNAAREALVLLLHAATFKFLTSITGIGLSLLLSWAQRGLMDRLQDALSDVQFEVERLLPVNAGHAVPRVGAPPREVEKVTLRSVP